MRNEKWFKEYSKFLQSQQWQLVRARILNYYGKKCRCCGTMRGKIQVHHLSYEHYRNPPAKDVTVLCEDCHKDVTRVTRQGRYKGVYAVALHQKNCAKRRRRNVGPSPR